jgi:hypothetical protein
MEENDIQQTEANDRAEILASYYTTLNPTIQKILVDEQTALVVNTIIDEAGLDDNEAEIFGNEVTLALLGFGNPIHFSENLVKEGFSAERAPRVAGEADSKIFSRIKNELAEIYAEKKVTPPAPEPEPTPVISPAQPVIQARPVEPFIKTQNAERTPEPTHTLDREALLRELESPEPFNVPFTPRPTSFEEKMTTAEVAPKSLSTIAPELPSRDLYREKPSP